MKRTAIKAFAAVLLTAVVAGAQTAPRRDAPTPLAPARPAVQSAAQPAPAVVHPIQVQPSAPSIKVQPNPEGALVASLLHGGTWKQAVVYPVSEWECDVIWASSDGKTGGLWRYRLKITPIAGPEPSPDPNPQPDPQPLPQKLTVVVIEESTARTAEQAAIITSKELRDELAKRGHTIRVLDKDVTDGWGQQPDAEKTWAAVAAGREPYVLLVDPATGKAVRGFRLPATVDALLAELSK